MYITVLFVLTFADFLTEKIQLRLHPTFCPMLWFQEVSLTGKTLLVDDVLLNTKIYYKLVIFYIKYYWYVQVVYWRKWYSGVVKWGLCITSTYNNDIIMFFGFCWFLMSFSVCFILLHKISLCTMKQLL